MATLQEESHDLTLLREGRHYNPHQFLGLHKTEKAQVIRLWRPGFDQAHIEVLGKVVEATRVSEAGLFEYLLPTSIGPSDYRVYHKSGLLAADPYAQMPTLGDVDFFLFNKGCHYTLYSMLGAHVWKTGTRFAVWAPNAQSVSLLGDFNHWDGRICPMRSMGGSGVWELFVPGIVAGEKYKFEIRTKENYLRVKSDPLAFFTEKRPLTASVVFDVDAYNWKDTNWKRPSLDGPINIYELHLGSWRDFGTEFPNYREIAIELAKYCKDMGYTHVELLPVMEHPLDESWGYQVTGFFSVTSRYGTPADFQFFVDHMHAQGLGVILDWVPAHFPTDDFSLNRFDGSALYEHEDPRKGMHPHWQTAIFNYGRKEVSNFLIASALFWLDKMHIDGLRVDAVASMVYLDYGRKHGEWIPNEDGSNFNIDAIEFIKHLNAIVHERFPGRIMIAEESSSYAGVTHKDGLGFDLKWNMGWMNDTLRYFTKDPIYRKFHQEELTFSLLYAFTEKFMCVLSHDEVVHGKGSLLNKMPGPDWQKFANLRLLYSYLMCHPGKKLTFMGVEVGQWSEWYCKAYIDWYLLEFPLHQGLFRFIKEMNHFYLREAPLWENDFSWEGYEWIDFSDAERSVISYFRKSSTKSLVCVHNFTPGYISKYPIHFPVAQGVQEVFNSDRTEFGGSHKINEIIETFEEGFFIELAPLATMIFQVS